MVAVKIIIGILAIVVLKISVHYKNKHKPWIVNYFLLGVAMILVTTFCCILIFTNWNCLALVQMLLLIVSCLYIWFESSKKALLLLIGCFILFGTIYLNNISDNYSTDEQIISSTVISLENVSTTDAEFEGVLNITNSEESVYKYYYELDNGELELSTLPADSTVPFYIESDDEPHVDKIKATSYLINYNYQPPKPFNEHSEIKYKLYVPKTSVTEITKNPNSE